MTASQGPQLRSVARVHDGMRMQQVQRTLRTELHKVASRFRQLRLWKALAIAWFLAAVVGFCIWASANPVGRPQVVVPLLGGLAATLAMAGVWLSKSGDPDPVKVAQEIERTYPELKSCLLAAIEQRPDLPDGRFGFLQSSVILQAVSHSALNDWRKVVPSRKLTAAIVAQFVALALFVGTLVGVSLKPGPSVAAAAANQAASALAVQATGEFTFTVEPGDSEIEKGTSLLVLARVTGPIPADASLSIQENTDSDHAQIPMVRSLNDPVFGGRIPIVTTPLAYHVEVGGHVSPTYRVSVFEYPRLERADAKLQYPAYTGLEERVIQDVRSMSVVEGTTVTLQCYLNKPVTSATLTETGHDPIALHSVPGDKPLYAASILCDRTRKLTVALVDEAGRQNVQPAEIKIQVVPNLPPTVKPTFPARDVEVSAIEELDVKATVWDDFGVPRAGVTYSLAGRVPTEAILGEQIAGKDRKEVNHSIRLEDLKAEPDELVAYYFWAEDIGPDGLVRRTLGDMYFAEVRHFEEIFRQGEAETRNQQQARQRQQQQQQQGGGSPNANAAQQLGELQKQIVGASWKLIRREIGSQLTESFLEDAKQVAQSQNEALEQAKQLADKVNDAKAREHVSRVVTAMEQAATLLDEAQATPAREPLPLALVAEQAAYQALLKLRAREHEIVRQQQQQQQQQGQPNAQGRSAQQRQQMEQLELKDDENRYETQRLAQSQNESTEQRESRQVLNRLRELARRQHDLNDQLKDLQSALEEAKSAEKKEEIRQQLKRLQEEQEQILRDTDELKTRMESPENQERMSAEREQLEQARDQAQRASEALEKEQATKAAAAGARAERGFDDLREEFRRQTSGQFRDEMRDLLDQARQLERAEQELGRKITQAIEPDAENRSLRTETGREKIAEGLEQQRKQLSTIVDKMQQTIQEAEQSEPLLSEKLYDAAREVQSKNVSRALEAARQSVAQGLLEDARQLEQAAGKGIEEFREKIESAAESVLGDESESLRRAREELRNLSREVNDEIERKDPSGNRPRDPNAREERTRGQADRNGNPDENEGAEGEDSQSQNGTGRRRGQRGSATESEENATGETPEGETDPADPDGQAGGRQQRRRRRPGEQGENGEAGEPDENGDQSPGDRANSNGQRQRRQQGRPGDANPEGDAEPSEQPGQAGERGQQGERGRSGQPNPRGQQAAGEPGSPNDDEATNQPVEGDPMEENANEATDPQQRPGQSGQQRRDGQRGRGARNGSPNGERTGEPNDEPADGQQAETQPGRERNPNQQANPRGAGSDATGQRDNAAGPFDPTRATDPGGFAPFTGRDFREWSDRLRDVEEMVNEPDLRAEAARIRDRARNIRAEARRHSAEPNWDMVRMQIAEPLAELTNRVNEELLRRNSRQNVVPLDRDPVPPKYSEKTRRYYEQLGSGQ